MYMSVETSITQATVTPGMIYEKDKLKREVEEQRKQVKWCAVL